MHNMLIITFDGHESAHNGADALWRLHEHSAVTVYATTILARAADGSIDTLQQVDQGPLGTAIGTVVGSIIGSFGGPVGTMTGAAIGAARGAMLDHWDSEVRHDVVKQVSEELKPGEFLLLADVAEPDEQLIDERLMESGCTIVRRSNIQMVAMHIEHELEGHQTKLKQLRLKAEQAAGDVRESLSEKLQLAQGQLKVAWNRASERLRAEAAARKAVIEKQIADAPAEMRKTLETAKECAQTDADRRIAGLKEEFGQNE
ncbi:MAG: DUF1269 domain-containing protein [Fuerstiella sp.]